MADLVFHRDFVPQYGQAVPVAPGVRRVTAPNAGPLTFAGTNSYILGSGRVAIIDPGPADETHFRALMAATAGETVSHILVTHAHRDHSGGVKRLAAATGAPSHACRRHGAAAGRRVAGGCRNRSGFRAGHGALRRALIAGDGWQLEAVATPGHAGDHLVFALTGSDLIFSGDHVMAWSTTVVAPPEGSMADYMASLDRLLERHEDTYLPGHGGPVTKAHDYVRALKAHRREREAAILARPQARARNHPGHRRQRSIRSLYPALTGAAGLSVLAHLEEMIGKGQVGLRRPAGTGRQIPAHPPLTLALTPCRAASRSWRKARMRSASAPRSWAALRAAERMSTSDPSPSGTMRMTTSWRKPKIRVVATASM